MKQARHTCPLTRNIPAVSGNRPAPSPDSEAGVQAAERTGEARSGRSSRARRCAKPVDASAFVLHTQPLVRALRVAGSKGEHRDSILPLPMTSEVRWVLILGRQRSRPPNPARKRTHCPPPVPASSTFMPTALRIPCCKAGGQLQPRAQVHCRAGRGGGDEEDGPPHD